MSLLKSSKYVEPVLIPGSDYEIRISANNEEYVHFSTDIDYILGLKSVEALDPSVLAEMQRMNMAPSPKNVSDDELIRFCKSRYIQEPADCERWFDMLQTYAEQLGENYKTEMEEALQSESEETPVTSDGSND